MRRFRHLLTEEEERRLLDLIEEHLTSQEREAFRAVRRGEIPFERLTPRLRDRIRSLAATLIRAVLQERRAK